VEEIQFLEFFVNPIMRKVLH